MKCPKCNFDNPDDTIYCGKCAAPLKSAEEISITKTLVTPAESLQKGSTIAGRYKIIEELGRGGMGVVYKAEDTKLKRTVALKFLPPELTHISDVKERFMREAQAAAALDHPNICTVHEFDEAEVKTFISMAYIEGQSLKKKIESGPLELDEALRIATQLAEGLQEAHKKGVVHRDIKSANIMVDERGQAKIMDFGLARVAGGTLVTKEGTTMGTIAYMSPEQARGEEVDHRTDIWSLGIVLYEMVTGQLPFQGEYEQGVVYSILHEEAEPITSLRSEVPMELERVVRKAMSKSSDERYQHVGEVILDLRSIIKELESKAMKEQASATKPVPSIAVLPFINMSADKEQEYFCDGMAEELINALTKIKDLRVVARTSAFSFKGKEIDIREIGNKLNVETVLEGSVRKAGNRLRITAQLVNVADGYHLWSERFDRQMEDIFAIQDEISLAIVDKMKLKLLKEEKAKLVRRHTENLDAYNFYLKGRYFWNKRTEDGLKKSLENLQRAIEIDSEFALAHAGLSDTYATLGWYGFLPRKDAFTRAKAEAIKALEIDDTVGEAHTSLANIKTWCDWDWVDAEREYKRALALNSSDAEAHHMYAHFLEEMGRFEEAIREMKQALELEPLSLNINSCIGKNLYFARKYDESIEQLQKTLEMDPNYFDPYAWLGMAYAKKGMHEQAIKKLQKGTTFIGISPIMIAALGYAYASAGKRSEAQKRLDQLKDLSRKEHVDPYFLAWIYAGLDERERAFEWLNKAYEERSMYMTLLKVDPLFDNLRSDAKFTELLKKMGLE